MATKKQVDKKVKSPQQYESTNYDKFKFVEANRNLNEHHVKEIMKEIENKDLEMNRQLRLIEIGK